MQDTRNTQSLVRPTGNTQQIPIPPPIPQQAICAIPGKPSEYFVEAEDRRTAYRVFWDGTRGQCTCAGFPRTGACAHINAVKNRPQEAGGKSVKDIEVILSRYFGDSQLDDQYGDKGVKFEEVVKRLNEAFGATYWSFSHEEPVDCGDSFTCAGRLEVEVGGVKTWKENVGYCRYVDGEQADGMAGARTGSVQGALVDCALLFGVGLEQSSKPTANTERPQGSFVKSFAERTPF